MNLLDRFLNRTDFPSYEDFVKNLKISVPENFNFGFDVVDEYARLAPQKRALVWCNDKGEEKILTFAELAVLSDKTANVMRDMGIKKGDFVMTMVNRRWEYWVFTVACHKLGCVIIPATFLLTPKDIAYRVNNAGVKLLIATNEDDVLRHIADSRELCPGLKHIYTLGGGKPFPNIHDLIDKAPDTFVPQEKTTNEDMTLMYFTSGTTGNPKMVAHKYNYPLGFIVNAQFWQRVHDDGIHFTMAETGWAKCSWGKIYGQWIAGSAVFAYDYFGKFTPTDVLPLLTKYKITTFCAPPTIYRFLIKEGLDAKHFDTVTHCTTAGEPLPPDIAKEFENVTGLKIYEGFGQSESTVLLATFPWCKQKFGSMGLPSPIYDIYLADNEENEVPEGATGEICVKLRDGQIGLFYKYHNDGERTRTTFGTGIYHTGDLAYADSDGYFWFVGRKDDIIKSSGYRIGPFEVESALLEHPAVMECAITGVPDELRGQIVKATVVLAKGFEGTPELIKELQTHVKKTTAPYKYPRLVEFVDALPKTFSGKVRRVEIREKDGK